MQSRPVSVLDVQSQFIWLDLLLQLLIDYRHSTTIPRAHNFSGSEHYIVAQPYLGTDRTTRTSLRIPEPIYNFKRSRKTDYLGWIDLLQTLSDYLEIFIEVFDWIFIFIPKSSIVWLTLVLYLLYPGQYSHVFPPQTDLTLPLNMGSLKDKQP